MKNKLINIKNILRIIISVMVIISMTKSCAKALEYNAIVEYVNQTTNYYSGNSKYPNIALNLQQPAIQTKIMEICENYNGVIVYYSSGYVYWKFYNDNDGIITGGPNALYYQGSYATFTGIPTSNTIMNFRTGNTGAYTDTLDASFRTSANQYNNLPGMNFTTCQIVDSEPLTYVGQGGYSPMDKLEFHNAVENTAYNGSTYTYYYQGDFYSNNKIYLGYIEPNDSYYFEIRLKDSNTNVVKGTCFVALNTEPYTFYNDGSLYINDNFEVYVITRNLNYSTQYQIEITSYYGDGDTNLEEDIDWFIFLPQNATISGDYIMSLGSGDFTIQNNANQIIDNINNLNNTIESGNKEFINNINNSSEVDSILSETFSGDIETISSDLGFSALENPFTGFLFFVIEGVYDVLTEREDISLNTQYKNLNFNLSSTDFITPNGEFKTFIRNMLICVYIYGNYKWFHYMITLLETARINKFMAEIGTDEFYDTDIM